MRITRDESNGEHDARGLYWFDIFWDKDSPESSYRAAVLAFDELEAWMIYKGKRPPHAHAHADNNPPKCGDDLGVLREGTERRLWKKWRKHFEEQAK